MRGLIEALAGVLAGLSALGALVGAWAWWSGGTARAFWPLVRSAQIVAGVLALTSGIAAAAGHRPSDGLFWVYALVPVGVGFFAEQLRAVSAVGVLEARGLPDAAAVGQLEEGEQRSVVVAILRREMAVMAAASAVTCFLALRVLSTAAGL